MKPALVHSSVTKQYRYATSQPATTLAFLENDEPILKSITERDKKTEKSVHFATEKLESVSEAESTDSLQTSRDIISWLPSEHLYEEDTFMTETHHEDTVTQLYEGDTFLTETPLDTGTRAYDGDTFISETLVDGSNVKESEERATSTGQTYGTDTFVDLESEDETRTASEFSAVSEGPSSSDVFSGRDGTGSTYNRDFTGGTTPHSGERSGTYREWRDVTEIVKDIAELEESEFVTRADTVDLLGDEEKDEDTDVSTDSLEAEMAKEEFILAQIRRLKLGAVSSPRSLAVDSASVTPSEQSFPRLKGPDAKAQASFCKKAIQRLKNQKDLLASNRAVSHSELHEKAKAAKASASSVQSFGLNPAIVDRLRMENFKNSLDRKMQKLEEDTKKSEKYVSDHQYVEDQRALQEFTKHIERQVEGDRMEERIQAHLHKMHPVLWFADLVRDLPKHDEDSWDVLYSYKTLLEKRRQEDT